MSTFNGIIAEFPSIRIDYFRKVPDKPAPLVCFLSHVHSDHLQGLESLRSPFIYCSAVTRELLLRLEKYPHRMNFSKGILEARKQHYGHLAKILRPIPLNTPTEIELTPLQRIRVTLLDANHCAGAVMFLIEGQGKAILYTGDIRAESWWANSLTRHPALVPYACGLKTLDNIYLDTTFATKSNIFRHFPSKAEGLKELLEKVGRYPKDTIFYLRAWTFGYEEVWQALSTFLDSKVHVDRYQYGLYRSLASSGNGAPGFDTATFLCGFRLGNEFVPGCLTSDDSVRIHSCEPGVFCQTMKSKKSVYITPIVTRNNKTGVEVPEIGAGGGKGDLYQIHELELPDEVTVRKLEQLLSEHIEDESVLSQTKELLKLAFTSKHRALSLDEFGLADDADISFKDLASMLSSARDTRKSGSFEEKYLDMTTITFPYSRHSSYAELCELVQAFKPKDVFPCTVDEKNWNESVAMEGLFGHLCSGKKFAHDRHMRGARGEEMLEHEAKRVRYTIMSEARLQLQAMGDKVKFDIGPLPRDANEVLGEDSQSSYQTTNAHSTSEEFTREDSEETSTVGSVIHTNVEEQTEAGHTAAEAESESQQTISDILGESQETGSEAYQNRVRAYRAALDGTFDAWNEISLVSAGDNHAEEEVEL